MWVVILLVEHTLHPTLTATYSFLFKRHDRIALDGRLDAGRHSVSLLLGQKEVFVLVIDKGHKEPSFCVIQCDGTYLLSSDALVSALRTAQPEFATMKYAGDAFHMVDDLKATFNQEAYLNACYKEYNVVKYAALANIGIRFSDLPLEELYVDATATESDDTSHNRLQAVVEDHLAKYPVSDALKAYIQQQLLTAVRGAGRLESSNARHFCQKYGAVLVTGDPGSGKTCFIKSEILAYCKRRKSAGSRDASTVPDWVLESHPCNGSPV